MRHSYALIAAAALATIPASLEAAAIYSDSFNADTSANYTIISTKSATTGGVNTSDATFAYDYSTLGVPVAPHTTDGTTMGLRLRTDNLANTGDGNVLGFISVASKTIGPIATGYTIQADVWGNYIGGTSIAASGSNGTTIAGMGLGTSGTVAQGPLGNDGFVTGAVHDGGGSAASNSDYRVYVDNLARPTSTNSNYFAAGTSGTAEDNTNAYYSFLSSHAAPVAQTTAAPGTQGGVSPVGIISFAWHTFTLTQDGVNVTWAIDGVTIATVPNSAFTGFGGSNVSLGAYDTGTGGNTAAANQLYNADFWDNLVVTSLTGVPEPTCLSLVSLAGLTALTRRRR